jgi:cytolysin-activating lysine-acyltransferase
MKNITEHTNGLSNVHAEEQAEPSGHLKFDRPAPEGAAKTLSQVLGEIVWLMSQSPLHKTMLIADLEWMVMTPVLLQQFRLYYDSGDAKQGPKPIGVVLWAEVDSEVAGRLAQGVSRLRPQDWKSGAAVPEAERQLWVVDVIAPFGGAEDIVRELKAKVFPNREIRYVRMDALGKTVAVV